MLTLLALIASGAVIAFALIRVFRGRNRQDNQDKKLFPKHMYEDSIHHRP